MSFVRRYLDGSPTVLVVAPVEADGEAIASTLGSDSREFIVRTTAAVPADSGDLDESIACIVTTAAGSLDQLLAVIEQSTVQPHVVVTTTGATRELLAIANRPDIDACLDRTTPDHEEALLDAVRSAATAYEHQFEDAAKRYAFDSMIEHHDEAVYLKDAAGVYVSVADSQYWPGPDHMVGNTDIEMDEEDDGIDFMHRRHEKDVAVATGGDPVINEVTKHGDEDLYFWRRSTRIPWEGPDGQRMGMFGHSTDITGQREERQSLETRIEQLDQFSSYVSHDLQSPLQVASGYLDLARAGDEEAFDRVAAAHDRMGELIEDLQTMSGDESIGTKTRSVDLRDLAEEVWQVIDTERATLETDLSETTILYGSNAEVRPLLENLFKNAIVHGPANDSDGVTIRIGALGDGFYVADDGEGIPPADRERIFDDGYTTADQGTGTGLAIVADAAETHDWDLDVVESEDGGARFEFRNTMMVTDTGACTGVTTVESDRYDLDEERAVGNLKIDGLVDYDATEDIWTLSAAGSDIWREKNDFRFVYTPVGGPVRIQGRVSEIENVNPYSKAGFMVRSALDNDTAHGYIGRTPGAGAESTWSTGEGDSTQSQHLEEGGDGFEWFRVDRVGDRITCSVSADSDDWLPVDQRHVPLSDPIYVGLAVCSVVPRVNATATFEDVTIAALDPS